VIWRSAERQNLATVLSAIDASAGGSKIVSASNPKAVVIPRAWAFCLAVRRGPLSRDRIGAPNSR
jgi:hypothetical protein